MKENGIVSKVISDRLAEVAFQRSAACEKCRACRIAGEGMVAVTAVNEVGAKQNDIVEIEVPTETMVVSSLVVFLLPVFFLIVGYLLGLAVGEKFALPFAFLALAASFFIIVWFDRNIAQKERIGARITRIISGR